ncbi:DUF5615 family PIN-like protein [Endothiovibrio diazotrophicus]
MIFWIDAQLSPALAPWIKERFGVDAYSVKYLGYRDADDVDIFLSAKQAGVIVITKDRDFLDLLDTHRTPAGGCPRPR